ncbi:hypothetical protein BV401_11285 [Streptomyces malaysiensis subsp. malaysiensis]|uniref:Uncharacterized protein n=1 Tax=Streptomyces autolyticus TaxID=75293 RepID=A0ABN4W3E8_9ACTN|nr:hypothetical protein BV401_11285 [Streptomyces autolyticus]
MAGEGDRTRPAQPRPARPASPGRVKTVSGAASATASTGETSRPSAESVRGASKGRASPYGTRQQRSNPVKGRGFLLPVIPPIRGSRISPTSFQELAMADVAFVVTTIAVFALVAFVAKGVTKL